MGNFISYPISITQVIYNYFTNKTPPPTTTPTPTPPKPTPTPTPPKPPTPTPTPPKPPTPTPTPPKPTKKIYDILNKEIDAAIKEAFQISESDSNKSNEKIKKNRLAKKQKIIKKFVDDERFKNNYEESIISNIVERIWEKYEKEEQKNSENQEANVVMAGTLDTKIFEERYLILEDPKVKEQIGSCNGYKTRRNALTYNPFEGNAHKTSHIKNIERSHWVDYFGSGSGSGNRSAERLLVQQKFVKKQDLNWVEQKSGDGEKIDIKTRIFKIFGYTDNHYEKINLENQNLTAEDLVKINKFKNYYAKKEELITQRKKTELANLVKEFKEFIDNQFED